MVSRLLANTQPASISYIHTNRNGFKTNTTPVVTVVLRYYVSWSGRYRRNAVVPSTLAGSRGGVVRIFRCSSDGRKGWGFAPFPSASASGSSRCSPKRQRVLTCLLRFHFIVRRRTKDAERNWLDCLWISDILWYNNSHRGATWQFSDFAD